MQKGCLRTLTLFYRRSSSLRNPKWLSWSDSQHVSFSFKYHVTVPLLRLYMMYSTPVFVSNTRNAPYALFSVPFFANVSLEKLMFISRSVTILPTGNCFCLGYCVWIVWNTFGAFRNPRIKETGEDVNRSRLRKVATSHSFVQRGY